MSRSHPAPPASQPEKNDNDFRVGTADVAEARSLFQFFRRRYMLAAVNIATGEISVTGRRFWTRTHAESEAGHLTVLASCMHPSQLTRPPLRYEVRNA